MLNWYFLYLDGLIYHVNSIKGYECITRGNESNIKLFKDLCLGQRFRFVNDRSDLIKVDIHSKSSIETFNRREKTLVGYYTLNIGGVTIADEEDMNTPCVEIQGEK